MITGIRAIIFDIYGTLLLAPPGRIQPDPEADPKLREILATFGHSAPASPSTGLADLVRKHHARSSEPFPEIDLRILWRELLNLPADETTEELVAATEAVWHPSSRMPGAEEMLERLHRSGLALGLLSNAQCHTLRCLGNSGNHFHKDLIILSYQHGIAKPSPVLFQLMAGRLAARGISPGQTLFIGNDPVQDILPAAALGFRTALFAGHPSSARPGHCTPDFTINHWDQFRARERGHAACNPCK